MTTSIRIATPWILSAIVATSLFFSCTDKGQTEVLQQRIDSLQQVCQIQQGDLQDMTSFMTTISTSLDSIAITQNMLNTPNPEGTMPGRNELKQRLHEFGQLVDRQRQQIMALREQLEHSNSEHAEQIRKLLAHYEAQLKEKDAEIERLNKELEESGRIIIGLRDDNEKKDNIIKKQEETLDEQDEMLNTGYVIQGTSKMLKEYGVLTGGFLKKTKINSTNLNDGKFKKIDIRTYNDVIINAKKPTLLPERPASSYTLRKNADGTTTLTITDPAKFWNVCNYLIVKY